MPWDELITNQNRPSLRNNLFIYNENSKDFKGIDMSLNFYCFIEYGCGGMDLLFGRLTII